MESPNFPYKIFFNSVICASTESFSSSSFFKLFTSHLFHLLYPGLNLIAWNMSKDFSNLEPNHLLIGKNQLIACILQIIIGFLKKKSYCISKETQNGRDQDTKTKLHIRICVYRTGAMWGTLGP
ncbi:hypothetical protein OIU78_021091 [Salix suchowensis]|nr:hypothetical protein OIU78_021091 [Salix suchowensis]